MCHIGIENNSQMPDENFDTIDPCGKNIVYAGIVMMQRIVFKNVYKIYVSHLKHYILVYVYIMTTKY